MRRGAILCELSGAREKAAQVAALGHERQPVERPPRRPRAEPPPSPPGGPARRARRSAAGPRRAPSRPPWRRSSRPAPRPPRRRRRRPALPRRARRRRVSRRPGCPPPLPRRTPSGRTRAHSSYGLRLSTTIVPARPGGDHVRGQVPDHDAPVGEGPVPPGEGAGERGHVDVGRVVRGVVLAQPEPCCGPAEIDHPQAELPARGRRRRMLAGAGASRDGMHPHGRPRRGGPLYGLAGRAANGFNGPDRGAHAWGAAWGAAGGSAA